MSLSTELLYFGSRNDSRLEASTFGSEFVALKTAVDLIEGLRYKLRMFGIPVDGPTSVLCDNSSVVQNTTAPESPLKKKHLSIAYHRCREACAAKTIVIGYVNTKDNLADLATKVLPALQRHKLVRMILW